MTDRKVAQVFPPGEFLKEELEARGWTQTTLAEIMGRPVKTINDIVLGKRSITPTTAQQLAYALGTSAALWLNLESTYRLSQTKTAGDLVTQRSRLHQYPIKDMMRRGWIKATEDAGALEKSLLSFFGISSLDEAPRFAHSARKSTSYDDEIEPAQRAWMFRTKHLARAVSVDRFSEESLTSAIERLRSLLPNVEDIRLVPRILADSGIRFLVLEPLPSTKIDGLSFWLDDDERSPVIAVSLRFDRIDGFWHTLWHEVWHIKNRDGLTQPPVLDSNLVGQHAQPFAEKPPNEQAADRFACECSVSQSDLENFIARVSPLYSKQQIRGFAALRRVHPGIVVGQLQHRHEIDWSHSREMLEKVRHIVTGAALTDGWGHIPPINLAV